MSAIPELTLGTSSPAFRAFCVEVMLHWRCADAPKLAWLERDGERHYFRTYAAQVDGVGEGAARALCDYMLSRLKAINEGGELVWRARPHLRHEYPCAEMPTGRTVLRMRLCFIGGKTLSEDLGLVEYDLVPVINVEKAAA